MRDRKRTLISKSNIETIIKLSELPIPSHRPVKVIRWKDKEGKSCCVYLYSDNYPNLPSELYAKLGNKGKRLLLATSKSSHYWYNYYPTIILLIKSVSAALQQLATITSYCKSNIRDRATYCTVFFDFILSDPNNSIPSSMAEITKKHLLSFRDYLYREHRKEILIKGGTNRITWALSVPGIIKFFINRPQHKLTHESITRSTFPKFASAIGSSESNVEPYSDIEMYEIITASDEACNIYTHNWKTMREIEHLKIGNWKTLEDICWFIVNVENKSSKQNENSPPYYNLAKYFGLTKSQFHSQFSEEKIQELAEIGHCPSTNYLKARLDMLSDVARTTYACAWVRKTFNFLFDIRAQVIAASEKQDWTQIGTSLIKQLKPFINNSKNNEMLAYWEAAGLKPLNRFASHEIISLFLPSIDSIFPFYLFLLATSGVNLKVASTIDRYIVLPELNPNEVAYRGIKSRTGEFNNRYEDIVVEIDEVNGINERLQFVKNITAPFLKYVDNKDKNSVWIGINVRNQDSRKIITLTGDPYISANNLFCTNFGLQEIIFNNKELCDCRDMTFVSSRRLRKSYVLKEMEEEIPFHLIQTALADNSFEIVFRYYINTVTQRRLNFKAIAAIQIILFDKIRSYSFETKFAGEIIIDKKLSLIKNESITLMSACIDPFQSEVSEKQSLNERCSSRFDVCLGCKSSRVFKEHLPAICFRLLQYEAKKLIFKEQDWESSYGLYSSRAKDCLHKYANFGPTYSVHVDAAWIIAKTEGSVYLPPL